jgi:hypothetical protein
MNTHTLHPRPFQLGALLRGEAETMAGWIEGWTHGRTGQQVLLIAIGGGAFGAAMGCWRAPEQAAFAAVKLPLVLLGTAAGNALINGMLAPLLGLNLRLREAFAAVLMSFGLASAILGAQISWILRPFIGSPDLPVEFLRAGALQGNFFESVLRSAGQL